MKSATHQFIEDAIAGGWDKYRYFGTAAAEGMPSNPTDRELEIWLLGDKSVWIDPLAWQAVGKTRGWDVVTMFSYVTGKECPKEYEWIFKMHRFIDHLADGKTVDEALTAI